MKRYRLIIFAIIMSFFTSTFVSLFIISIKVGLKINFFWLWFERFIIAWPVVFLCILFFVPRINKFLDKFIK
ncbi:MAG: hypothetical protein CMM89_07570 [Rickettsiales bacterium]|nr:hypothetical protein [Rickettsiales bacterium]OUT43097.1 MAG: hypothetical protein CBB73_07350 [Pelagibacteraceae bacterium TMED13]